VLSVTWLVITIHSSSKTIVYCSSVSIPHKDDSKIDQVIPNYFDNKRGPRTYHNSTPIVYKSNKSNRNSNSNENENENENEDLYHIDKDSTCNLKFHTEWYTKLDSSVYSK
jgi:hypothetical protein